MFSSIFGASFHCQLGSTTSHCISLTFLDELDGDNELGGVDDEQEDVDPEQSVDSWVSVRTGVLVIQGVLKVTGVIGEIIASFTHFVA